jgi:hypothetical protein
MKMITKKKAKKKLVSNCQTATKTTLRRNFLRSKELFMDSLFYVLSARGEIH